MKVLIVDDDAGTLNTLRAGLNSFGFQVLTVRDGRQALNVIESSSGGTGPVELMVTDLKMPGMDGIELIQKVKKLKPDLSAILMTAYGDSHVRKEVVKLKNCAYLEKPFSPATLLRVITETIGG